MPVIPSLIDVEQCLGGLLPKYNLHNQCAHLFLHIGIVGTRKMFTQNSITREEIDVGLTLPAAV